MFSVDNLSAPFVITGALEQWPARKWTLETLSETLDDKMLRCRLMRRDKETNDGPSWESDGVYVECLLHHFRAWCQGEASGDNPLQPFSPLHFSAYIDYKYMAQVFTDCPHMLSAVRWCDLGLKGRDGADSTMWVGSGGAATPCHYDTYGFNLVAQITGRKRWVLFPPDANRGMYPTRIPYEESSVFSQVDVACPDLHTHPQFKDTRPTVVTLEAGQVLYVPRHWWHHVTCAETAISINTWVPMDEDAASRLHEAATRVLASSLLPYLADTARPDALDDWINPTEELEAAAVNVEYLKASLSSWKRSSKKEKPTTTEQHLQGARSPLLTASHLQATGPCVVVEKSKLLDLAEALKPCPVLSVTSPFQLSAQDWRDLKQTSSHPVGPGMVGEDRRDLKRISSHPVGPSMTGEQENDTDLKQKNSSDLPRYSRNCDNVNNTVCPGVKEDKRDKDNDMLNDTVCPNMEEDVGNIDNDTLNGKVCPNVEEDEDNDPALKKERRFRPTDLQCGNHQKALSDDDAVCPEVVEDEDMKNKDDDSASRKRKHTDRHSGSSSLVLNESPNLSDSPVKLCRRERHGDDDIEEQLKNSRRGSRRETASSGTFYSGVHSAGHNMTIYVPKPCDFGTYMEVIRQETEKDGRFKGDNEEAISREEGHRIETSNDFEEMRVSAQNKAEDTSVEGDNRETSSQEEGHRIEALNDFKETRVTAQNKGEDAPVEGEKKEAISQEELSIFSVGEDNSGTPTDDEKTEGCDPMQEALLRSVLHPDVIALIVDKLKEQM